MSSGIRRAVFLTVASLLVVYAAIFPLLTFDTLTKIFGRASTFETRGLFLILYLEISRLFTSVVAITIAIVLLVRGWRRRDARALAIFLLFATITYEKVFGSNGYPGPVQERVTEALFAAGVRPALLIWLFGPVAWAVWPAAAALLRFSAVFPHELHEDVLEASGQDDRRGFLRSKGVAGADIGAFFRGMSKRVLHAGGFQPVILAGGAALLVALHTALTNTFAGTALWVIAFLAMCVAVTNIRAAYVASEGADRVRITWMVEGFVLALFMFLISAAILLVIPGAVAHMIGFLVFMFAPATIMVCLALSVLDRGELDTQDLIDRTVRNGVVALVTTLTFAVVYGVLSLAADRFGASRALAFLAALGVMTIGFATVQRSSDWMRLKVLERGASE